MADFEGSTLLATDSLAVWHVVCRGGGTPEGDEECGESTHFVLPYWGLYVRHVGRTQAVIEPSQMAVFNANEPYRVSHPVDGGDACVSIGLSASTLLELIPSDLLQGRERATLNRSYIRIDAKTQAHAAVLRHRLNRKAIGILEAESMTLALVGRALGQRGAPGPRATARTRRFVDHAKVVIAADLGCRRALADIATEVGLSPIYLTQIFQHVEGIPMYRYQLRLRLARALDLLGDYDDVTDLALALGFSSHSHFSAAFKQVYGQTPSAFRKLSRLH